MNTLPYRMILRIPRGGSWGYLSLALVMIIPRICLTKGMMCNESMDKITVLEYEEPNVNSLRPANKETEKTKRSGPKTKVGILLAFFRALWCGNQTGRMSRKRIGETKRQMRVNCDFEDMLKQMEKYELNNNLVTKTEPSTDSNDILSQSEVHAKVAEIDAAHDEVTQNPESTKDAQTNTSDIENGNSFLTSEGLKEVESEDTGELKQVLAQLSSELVQKLGQAHRQQERKITQKLLSKVKLNKESERPTDITEETQFEQENSKRKQSLWEQAYVSARAAKEAYDNKHPKRPKQKKGQYNVSEELSRQANKIVEILEERSKHNELTDEKRDRLKQRLYLTWQAVQKLVKSNVSIFYNSHILSCQIILSEFIYASTRSVNRPVIVPKMI
eukprot:GHVQ01000797.1.p1 GENE.GHVQ01000797.1~~GHVQ01000797.1.p1  ORF type:complete len:388 (+),score=34.90 GHVQ01000797.1:321-1484(+)